MELFEILDRFRCNYFDIRRALPWLDSCIWKNDKPAFTDFAKPIETNYVKSFSLDLTLKSKLSALRSKNAFILRYNPDRGSLDSFHVLFPEMVENKIPLAILHTDVDFTELISFADKNGEMNIIIESGPRKILYFFDIIKEVLRKCENVFLCTYNLCNWLGHERLIEIGFGDRLIYGSHMPAYNCDVSMGPVILSNIDWKTKCNIAGNNLRKLLGMEPVYPVEVKYYPPHPFIIDTHSHNIQPNNVSFNRFPLPDINFSPSDWIDFMNLSGIDQLYLMPMEAVISSKVSSKNNVQDLIKYSPDRFSYLEVFNPNGDAEHIKTFEESLLDPKCVGIKLHPVEHKINADDKSYERAYQLAAKYHKPIMSHSWEISSYNPEQYRSHPDRFLKYLREYSDITFVFGHAGGRPSTIDSIEKICNNFDNVYVDIAGDYYDNGLIEILSSTIGPEKILFGSDVNWMDTRSNLAPVLSSDLEIGDILKILRFNALKVFNVKYNSKFNI